MHTKFLLLGGCISAFFAVILGAFGAHGLEKLLDSHTMAAYETGVRYQFYHSFALISSGILSAMWPDNKGIRVAGIGFLLGIIIFSGSLYLYTFTGMKSFGMMTPVGGIFFIVAWLLLIGSLWKQDIKPYRQ